MVLYGEGQFFYKKKENQGTTLALRKNLFPKTRLLGCHIFKSMSPYDMFCNMQSPTYCKFYKSTCSLDELMKKKIIQKFQILEILKERVARQRTHLLSHLIKKLCSMGSKCLALDASHM